MYWRAFLKSIFSSLSSPYPQDTQAHTKKLTKIVFNRKKFAGAESVGDIRIMSSIHLYLRTDVFHGYSRSRHCCSEQLWEPKGSDETKENVLEDFFLRFSEHKQKTYGPVFSLSDINTLCGERTQAPGKILIFLFRCYPQNFLWW